MKTHNLLEVKKARKKKKRKKEKERERKKERKKKRKKEMHFVKRMELSFIFFKRHNAKYIS